MEKKKKKEKNPKLVHEDMTAPPEKFKKLEDEK